MKNLLGFVGKINPKTGLGILTLALGVCTTLVNNKSQSVDRAILKSELKNEILEELLKEKN